MSIGIYPVRLSAVRMVLFAKRCCFRRYAVSNRGYVGLEQWR